jgi:MFS transporter, DHA1 family, multidrug resistance protein
VLASLPQTSKKLSPRALIAFCGLLLALNAFSCDILLPAFMVIQRDLAAPIERVQSVIPLFLLAAGLGQLVFGTLSDRFGRRPVILFGLCLYLTGTCLCLFAPTIGVLQAGRVLQGFASACGVVVARAVLRDTHSGAELGRAMAFAMAIFSFGPIVAPLLGMALITWFGGWRGAFLGMAAFGIGLLAVGAWRLQETNRAPDDTALELPRLLSASMTILSHPQSRYFLAIAGVLNFAIVSTVSNAPRIYASAFGVTGFAFAAAFAATALGIIFGQILNARVIGRHGILRSTRLAAVTMLSVAAILCVGAYAAWLNALTFTLLIFIFNASFLIVMANSISLVIDPHRTIAGLASSLYGFISQTIGSLLTLLTVPLFRGDVFLWATGQLVVTVIVMVALLFYRPRSRAAADGFEPLKTEKSRST